MSRLTKKGFDYSPEYVKSKCPTWFIVQALKDLQKYEDEFEEKEKYYTVFTTVLPEDNACMIDTSKLSTDSISIYNLCNSSKDSSEFKPTLSGW